jgi:hypothetical protein
MIILKEAKEKVKEAGSGFVNADAQKKLFTSLMLEFNADIKFGGVPEIALVGTVQRALNAIQSWMFMSYQDRNIGNDPEIQKLKKSIASLLARTANQINSLS